MNATTHKGIFTIGIDGPSGAGKTTLGLRLAQHYDYAFLDTGLIYRWLGLLVYRIWGSLPPPLTLDIKPLLAIVRYNVPEGKQMMKHFWESNPLEEKSLGQEYVAQIASQIAGLAVIREMVIPIQRHFILHPPGGKKGAVLVGRDITTKICPDGDVLFFLDATKVARQARLQKRHPDENVKIAKKRDMNDRNRSVSPLIKNEGVIYVDTTHQTVEKSFQHLCALVKREVSAI